MLELTIEQDRLLRAIAGRFSLRMILLFGSAVTGRLHPRSDLDIAVQLDKKELPYSTYADLLQCLHEVFPGRQIDLSLINHADPLFLKKITESCRLLTGDLHKLQELKLYAFKRYQDHRRFFEMEKAYLDRFVRAATVPR